MPSRANFILGAMAAVTNPQVPIVINHLDDGSHSRDDRIQYSVLVESYASRNTLLANGVDRPWAAASIAKLLVAIALIESSAQRSIGRGFARVDSSAFESKNTYFAGAATGGLISLAALVDKMIVESDNFAANVLIEHIGIPTINAVAADIGLSVTRVHGLYYETTAAIPARIFTTARECGMMLRHIVQGMRSPQGGGAASYKDLLVMMSRQSDRRFIPSAAGPNIVVADKTGEIHGQINDCAVVAPFSKDPVLFAVLAHGRFNVYSNSQRYMASIEHIQSHVRDVYRRTVAPVLGSDDGGFPQKGE